MRPFKTLVIASLISLLISPLFAAGKKYSQSTCCSRMGGVRYCDSSVGRFVCNNGFYSVCYCTPHAVMDLQLLRGCCLWRGGVLPPNVSAPSGLVVCRDGSLSEECSLQNPVEKIAAW